MADRYHGYVGQRGVRFLMKIGFVQFSPSFGEKKKNFDTVCNLLKEITADIIVLPELFNTGYVFLNNDELEELAEPTDKGETANFIFSLAREKNCCFAYGFAEKNKTFFYDSMALMSPHGLIGVYRKSHLFFEEKKFFQPGNTGFHVFTYKNVKLGMLICFDWIYPEATRTLALKGAQIILHPANLVTPYCPDAMITRAIENRIYIVTADRIGKEKRDTKELSFIGKSQVVSPKGEILIRADTEECVKIVDINPDLALNKKFNQYNNLLEDRREDLYFK
jgi:predicted amidohydrolase